MSGSEDEPLAASDLPVLPLKETVVFPDSVTPLAIGQERSIKLVDDVVGGEHELLALVTARDASVDQPGFDDLYEVGTAASIHRLVRVPDGTLRVLVQGHRRIRIERRIRDEPYLVAAVADLPDETRDPAEVDALARNCQTQFGHLVGLAPYLPDELQVAIANVEGPGALANLVASTLRIPTEERQRLLELVDVGERLREVSKILYRELEVLELGSKIQSQVQSELEQGQREFFLRQQLKAIQQELGEGDEQQAEVNELREQIDEAGLTEEADRAARRELSRLEKLPPAAGEYGVIRTYLDWILTLPWTATTADNLDLERAQRVLDDDHHDLEKVKERIVEFLAVGKLKGDVSGSVLCFVGPPGVGKTSLGQSIARALERRFVRISVGGVRDEAEIRGHRRTYIGALPGTVLRALRDAESRNPVFLVDEIDKMGSDFRGDPASAMLEVLDPEQNRNFRDHYLDLPFDLSQVLFICTANQTETIPGPLLDRMDVIELSGYTERDKLSIARRYLVPKQLEAHGLARRQVSLTDGALGLVIREYTREAGVRNLERRIADLCRKTASEIAAGRAKRVRIDEARVRRWLGPGRFPGEVRKRTADPGVATGLAWTPAGGDVLFVEASAYSGRGRLKLTGQLSDVMRESGQAAYSWVRAHARELGIQQSWFERNDVHVHVPAGAVPKDGPSAGVTIAAAIVSLAQDRPLRSDVGMTGEITLSGQVLPIGGLREKVLAAQRAELTTVLLPKENEPELTELPAEARDELELVPCERIEDVLARAFAGGLERRRRVARRPSERQAARPA
jgi:ATP-dependent Lon protease